MAKYNYVLSHNTVALTPTADAIRIFISQNRDIDSWYEAFPGSYIIKSDKELVYLNDQLVRFFRPSQFILTWMYPGYASGLLPSDAWQWFNEAGSLGTSVK